MSLVKRSVMTLYSGGLDIYSHQVRIVLAEKGVGVDVLNIDLNYPNEDLAEINPYNSLPTLVDRELVLYEPGVIMEYLDERFPHPPLLPVYPVARAQSRLWIFRIEKDWCRLSDTILSNPNGDEGLTARQELRESLISVSSIFSDLPFFMSEDYTLVDCCLAPLLWRLSQLGIEISKTSQTKPLIDYMKRVFERSAFDESLTDLEREFKM